ncbi:MAG: L,D-transpeptidase [Coriobacteriia bacterium]|nr:L,D-transpeptidase [Coriobacteriia bacterium]
MKSRKRIQKNPNIRGEVEKRKTVSTDESIDSVVSVAPAEPLATDASDPAAETTQRIDAIALQTPTEVIAALKPAAEELALPVGQTRQDRKKSVAAPQVKPVTMAQPKPKKKRTALIAVLVSLATLLLLLGAGWFYLDMRDTESAQFVPNGITLDGIALGGMTKSEVAETAAQIVEGYESTVIDLKAGDNTVALIMGDYISSDPEEITAQIMEVRLETPLWDRLMHDYFDGQIPAAFEIGHLIDTDAIAATAADVSAQYSYAAVDAMMYFEGFTPVLTDAQTGYWIDPDQTAVEIENAILENLSGNEVTQIYAASTMTTPQVYRDDLKVPVLTCNIGARQVMLWNGDELVKTYPCAVGQPAYPTFPGEYYIGAKEVDPPWYNPDPEGWGRGAPKFIPGPNDALGARGLHIFTLEGYDTQMLFHGALASGLAGTATTHGCIRMFNSDVIDLYDRVPVGTRVSLSY